MENTMLIPVFLLRSSADERLHSLQKATNLCQTVVEGHRKGNVVTKDVMKSIVHQEKKNITGSSCIVPLYVILKQFTFEYHQNSVEGKDINPGYNTNNCTTAGIRNILDMNAKAFKIMPKDLFEQMKCTVKFITKQIEGQKHFVVESTSLEKKLTHHKEKAEKHFELYAEYNKKYIDFKSKSDGNGDIRKLEKRMNKEGKCFTHHDIIVQDLSEEYENLQQQSIATMMQLAQTLLDLERVIEAHFAEAIDYGLTQLRFIADTASLSQCLRNKIKQIDVKLIAQHMYQEMCSVYTYNATASPAVVQTTTPEINSFAKQGRSDGECAEGTGCVKQSTMPGMNIKQKLFSDDGKVAFGYRRSFLGFKKWKFYKTAQEV